MITSLLGRLGLKTPFVAPLAEAVELERATSHAADAAAVQQAEAALTAERAKARAEREADDARLAVVHRELDEVKARVDALQAEVLARQAARWEREGGAERAVADARAAAAETADPRIAAAVLECERLLDGARDRIVVRSVENGRGARTGEKLYREESNGAAVATYMAALRHAKRKFQELRFAVVDDVAEAISNIWRPVREAERAIR